MTEITAMKPSEMYVLSAHKMAEIPLAYLIVDRAYQRDLNEAAITRIVNNFDWNKFEPLTVNHRSWEKSSKNYAVIDGQHKLAVAKKLGHSTALCRVVEVDRQMEAQLFVELNRNRAWLVPFNAFKAEVDAGNPAAVEIKNCIESRNLTIGGGGKDDNHVAAVTALQRIYARGGFLALGRVIDVAILSWEYGTERRFAGNILLGIDEFLAKNHRVDLARLSERMASTTPRVLLAKSHQLWYGAKLSGHANKSIVDCIAEQIGKQYRKYGQVAA